MTFKEAIQKDGQRHLYVKSAITSRTTQYMIIVSIFTKTYTKVLYHFSNL